jgi:hypothetical protein
MIGKAHVHGDHQYSELRAPRTGPASRF